MNYNNENLIYKNKYKNYDSKIKRYKIRLII